MWPKEMFRKKTAEAPKKERIYQKKLTTLTVVLDDGTAFDLPVETKGWKHDMLFDRHLGVVSSRLEEIGKIGLYIPNENFYPTHRIRVVNIGPTVTTDVPELSIKEN